MAYQIGNDQGGAVVGATLLLTTLSLFHVVAGLMSRDQVNTIFDRDAVPAVAQLRRYGVSLLAIVAITTLTLLERIFGTGDLTANQWAICIGLASSLLFIEELVKLVLRRRVHTAPTAPAVTATPAIAH
jgi:Ca2+-transporting ATPase